jgi:hypothetical protein
MDLRSMFFQYPHGMWFLKSGGAASGDSSKTRKLLY